MYNYGSPRVGNRAFARLFDSLVPDAFRVRNMRYIIMAWEMRLEDSSPLCENVEGYTVSPWFHDIIL